MKSYSEIEANAYKKAEQRIINRKKHRSTIIHWSSAFTLGTAAVLGIGIFTHAMKPPKKPSTSHSEVILETNTNSSEATTLSSKNTTDSKTTTHALTNITSTAATTSSALQTPTTTMTHTTTVTNTPLSSTTTTKTSDEAHEGTTATTVHMNTSTSTTKSPVLTEITQNVITQVVVTADTTQAAVTTTATTPTANLEIYQRFSYVEFNKGIYTTKGWEARPIEVGELISTEDLVSDDSLLRCNVQIYECISIAEAGYRPIVLKFEGYDGYWIYWQTL